MAIIFNKINGDSSANSLNTTEQQDIVFANSGDDTITADFKSVDYIIGGNGEDTLVINLPYDSFTIEKKLGITEGYTVRYTGTGGKANIVKGVEFFQFAEGTISLEDFYAGKPIDNGQVEQKEFELDGHGEIKTPELIDAGTDAFLYKDDLTLSNFVEIKNFSTKEATKEERDQIEIIADADDVVSVQNYGEDVVITNNSTTVEGEVIISSITLLGVASVDNLIYDVASLNDLMGFEALKITLV